jgi:hypothetical protein
MEGSVERTRRRLEAHNYSDGRSVPWTKERVEEFLSLNGKGRDGRYERKDWQLAEHFGSSIPSIQYMRRKCRKVENLLGARASRVKVVDYLLCAESVLSRGMDAVEASFAAAKARAKSQAAPARKAKTGGRPTGKNPARSARKPAERLAGKPGSKAASRAPTKSTLGKGAAARTPVVAKPAAKKTVRPIAQAATARQAPASRQAAGRKA